MRLLWLPEVLRAAGLTVVEVPGWRTLGSSDWTPTGGIVHATADGAAANPVADAKDDAGAINVIRNGRPGLSGPIASAYQSRSGVWHVIASGRSNTALTGTAGPLKGLGNSRLLGIEHENDNRGEPWPSVQYNSAIRGWAAICRKLGWPASRLAGHKEHDPARKSDPKGIDMSRFRADVARLLAGEDDDMPLSKTDAQLVAKEFLATVLPDFAGIKGMSVRVALQNLVQQGHGPKFADWQATKNEAEIIALLKSLGGADTLEIVAEIRAQGEQTRAAILAIIADLAPGLAAAIVGRLDAEVDESQLGEVLAHELAAMLGAAAAPAGQD